VYYELVSGDRLCPEISGVDVAFFRAGAPCAGRLIERVDAGVALVGWRSTHRWTSVPGASRRISSIAAGEAETNHPSPRDSNLGGSIHIQPSFQYVDSTITVSARSSH
jgi:hypothetical protein